MAEAKVEPKAELVNAKAGLLQEAQNILEKLRTFHADVNKQVLPAQGQSATGELTQDAAITMMRLVDLLENMPDDCFEMVEPAKKKVAEHMAKAQHQASTR